MRRIFGLCLVGVALAPASLAQQPRYSSDWRRDAERGRVAEGQLRKMTDELKSLVDEAERARAADPRFLRDLRDLTRRYAPPPVGYGAPPPSVSRAPSTGLRTPSPPVSPSPVGGPILRDDFRDGDISRNPAWASWGSGLTVDRFAGVTFRPFGSAQATQNEPERRDTARELTGALVDTFLGQLSRPETRENAETAAAASPGSETGMKTEVSLPNAFSIRLVLTAGPASNGRFEFGVTQGQGNSGYRVAYNSTGSPALEILQVLQGTSRVIGSVAGPLDFTDGNPHKIRLRRGRRGSISVNLDGRRLVRLSDFSFRDPFDGVLMVAKSGEFTVHSVEAFGTN